MSDFKKGGLVEKELARIRRAESTRRAISDAELARDPKPRKNKSKTTRQKINSRHKMLRDI